MIDAVGPVPAHDAELDASGLSCPLPLLKAKLELNRLPSGAVLYRSALTKAPTFWVLDVENRPAIRILDGW